MQRALRNLNQMSNEHYKLCNVTQRLNMPDGLCKLVCSLEYNPATRAVLTVGAVKSALMHSKSAPLPVTLPTAVHFQLLLFQLLLCTDCLMQVLLPPSRVLAAFICLIRSGICHAWPTCIEPTASRLSAVR